MDAEPVEQIHQMRSKADTDGHVDDRVFENQVPSDDPRHQFAHGCVSVGIGAAGDGNHGRHLGIAERRERADHGNQHHGDRDAPALLRVGRSDGRVVDQEIEQRRINDGFGIEFLSGNGSANDGENAGADDGPNSERGQRPGPERFLQPLLR